MELTFEKVTPFQVVEILDPVRFVPNIVTETVDPGEADCGLTEVTDGYPEFVIENMKVRVPYRAVSAILAFPVGALESTVNVAAAELPLEVISVNVRPGQFVERPTSHRFRPLIATVPLNPVAELAGLIEIDDGIEFTVTAAETVLAVELSFT